MASSGVDPQNAPPAGSDNAAAMATLQHAENVRRAAQMPSASGTVPTIAVNAAGDGASVVQRPLPPIDHDFTQPDAINEKTAVARVHGIQNMTPTFQITDQDVQNERLKAAQALEFQKDMYYLRQYNPHTIEGLTMLERVRPQALERIRRAIEKKWRTMAQGEMAEYFAPRTQAEAEFAYDWYNTDEYVEFKGLVRSMINQWRGAGAGKPFNLSLSEVWRDIFKLGAYVNAGDRHQQGVSGAAPGAIAPQHTTQAAGSRIAAGWWAQGGRPGMAGNIPI